MEPSCSLGSLRSWQLLRNLPGALGERSSKQETAKQVLSVSEWGAALSLHLAEYPQVTVMAQELWVGDDLFSLMEMKNVIASLCHTLFWKWGWFDTRQPLENQFWFQIAEGRCLWSDWLCAPWNCCQGSGCGKCGPARPWGYVCMEWELSVLCRSTSWMAESRDSLSLQTKIPVVPWRTHILICFSPSILWIRQAAADKSRGDAKD